MIRIIAAGIVTVVGGSGVAAAGGTMAAAHAARTTVPGTATSDTATSDTGWTKPVDGAVVSQPFGCTPYAMEPVDRSCASGHIHTGIDLAIALGTPVHATLDGVAHVAVSATGYGLHVVLDHGNGLTTLYAHLESVSVHDGDVVAAGDVIGLVGSTGNSTGPHLHFEVRRDGITEDPTLDVALP